MTAPKWYDMTLSYNKCKELGINGKREVGKVLLEPLGTDRYVVGEEIGAGGYHHYQCRVVFKTEMPVTTLIDRFAGIGSISPTHVRDFKYCEKEGNYYRSWEEALNKFTDLELYEWQRDALAHFEKQDERKIMVIVDTDGNHGKSWLSKFCVATRKAQYVPPLTEAQDLMAFAMAKPSNGYIFDLPRASCLKKRKGEDPTLGMWSAVEQIKNGYLYDKRYNFRDMWIDPPKILVFTNEEPRYEALSLDRWDMYSIVHWNGKDKLVHFRNTTDVSALV